MGTRLGAEAARRRRPSLRRRQPGGEPGSRQVRAEETTSHTGEQPGRGQEIALRDPPRGRARRSARGRAARQARVPRRPSKSTVASIAMTKAAMPGGTRHFASRDRGPADVGAGPPIGTGGQRRETPQRREVHGEDVRVPLPVSAPKPTMPASVTAVQASARPAMRVGTEASGKMTSSQTKRSRERGGVGHTPARGRVRATPARDPGRPCRRRASASAPSNRVRQGIERRPDIADAGHHQREPHPPDDPDQRGREILHGMRIAQKSRRDHEDEERSPTSRAALRRSGPGGPRGRTSPALDARARRRAGGDRGGDEATAPPVSAAPATK